MHPLGPSDSPDFVNGYVQDANNNYVTPTGYCGSTACTPVAVVTPEEFWPQFGTYTFDQSVAHGVTNLDQAIRTAPPGSPIVVYGYSQSARIASIEKGILAAENSTLPVSFLLIANPNRPNGGILQRFQGTNIPILGVTFDGTTPTHTGFETVDITRQYDGWSDFPLNPLNPLATANAGFGIYYLHGDYASVGLDDALYQGRYGDTDYYLIPADRLPLLMPLAQAGVPDPVLAVADAPLRVLVEAGYDRTISPGEPTKATLLYFPNPFQTGVDFIVAIPTGLDDGAQQVVSIRPFGTPAPDVRGPYGVGGPPVNAGTFGTADVVSPDASLAPIGSSDRPVLAIVTPPAAAGSQQPAALLVPVQAPKATAPAIPTAKPPNPPAADLPSSTQLVELPKPVQGPKPLTRPAQVPTLAPASPELPPASPNPVDLPTLLPKPVDVPEALLKPVDVPEVLPKPVEVPKVLPKPVEVPKVLPTPVEVPKVLPTPPPLPKPVDIPAVVPDVPPAPLAPPPLPLTPPHCRWLPRRCRWLPRRCRWLPRRCRLLPRRCRLLRRSCRLLPCCPSRHRRCPTSEICCRNSAFRSDSRVRAHDCARTLSTTVRISSATSCGW